MPEGAVTYVMEKTGQAGQLDAEVNAGSIQANILEGGIEGGHESPGQVHDPDRVLETCMFARRVDPPGRLQLVYAAEPLDPTGINKVFLCDFSGIFCRHGEGDKLVNRIA